MSLMEKKGLICHISSDPLISSSPTDTTASGRNVDLDQTAGCTASCQQTVCGLTWGLTLTHNLKVLGLNKSYDHLIISV